MERTLDETKASLIANINKRVTDKVIEKQNGDTLIRFINTAQTIDDANFIYTVGTKYKSTGFHFDFRKDKIDNDTIYYFQKNKELSFQPTNKNGLTHKLIIGDNYKALLNLLIEYRSKIDVIYIDPPYGVNSMGDFAKTNYENNISRDNLLSMLQTRLLLARELLSDTGVIFCSIDDKNQAYIKCLFDDIFGEQNFVATYLWKKTDTPPSLSKKVRKKYEYILCYTKTHDSTYSFSQGKIDGGDVPLLNKGNSIKEIEFPVNSVHFKIADGMYYNDENMKIKLLTPVQVVNGINKNAFKALGEWKWNQDFLNNEVKNGTYFLVKTKQFSIRFQRNYNDLASKTPQNNIDSEVDVGTNEDGDKEVKSIFNKKVFDNPKPVSLLKFLINMTNKSDDIVILDFFAGSGTTGQAVMELNKEDDGQRQFILVQLDEKLNIKPETNSKQEIIQNAIEVLSQQNLPLNIASLTNERLRRVMTGKTNDGSADFKWLKDNTPYGDGLDVYNIASVSAMANQPGQMPFEVIDETLYGKEKLNINDKIDWVCSKFEMTNKKVESDKDWEARVRGQKDVK